MKTKQIAGRLRESGSLFLLHKAGLYTVFKSLGRSGALKRNMPLAVMLIAVSAALMANYAFSADNIYAAVDAGGYIDVGLDTARGVHMDLVEEGLTHKVLEVEITSDIPAQDIQLLIAENNFDAKIGGLVEYNLTTMQEPIYETVCNPYNATDAVNGSVASVQNCSTMQKGVRNVDVEQWLPLELKASEKNGGTALGTFGILGKGKYRYSFNTPIIQTEGGWGNKGTVFLKVGASLFADKQHSSWWDTSCTNRKSVYVSPQVTDSNMQLQFNLSATHNLLKAYVIDNRTNTELAWVNKTREYIFTNTSVTANSAFGIDVYYNCNANASQYNYSHVMLRGWGFENQAEMDNFGDQIKQGTWGINSTNVLRGIGSAQETSGAANRITRHNITRLSNISVISHFYDAGQDTGDNHGIAIEYFPTGDTTSRVGIFTTTSTTYYVDQNETGARLVLPIARSTGWHEVRFHVNGSGTKIYIDGNYSHSRPNLAGIDMVGITSSSSMIQFDVLYVYRDYDENNPSYSVGTEETVNTSGESEARTDITSGITSQIPSASIYTDQQIYARYLNGTQMFGSFDKVAVYGNQRWAFNYITSGESYSNMINITPSFYVWEKANLTTSQIQSQVAALINSTKA